MTRVPSSNYHSHMSRRDLQGIRMPFDSHKSKSRLSHTQPTAVSPTKKKSMLQYGGRVKLVSGGPVKWGKMTRQQSRIGYDDGGKVKPYTTRDSLDPRIQSYRDSLDIYNNYKELEARLQEQDYNLQSHLPLTNAPVQDSGFMVQLSRSGRRSLDPNRNKPTWEEYKSGAEKLDLVTQISPTRKETLDFIPYITNPTLGKQIYSDSIEPEAIDIYNYPIDEDRLPSLWKQITASNQKDFNIKWQEQVQRENEAAGDYRPGDARVVANYENVKPKQEVTYIPPETTKATPRPANAISRLKSRTVPLDNNINSSIEASESNIPTIDKKIVRYRRVGNRNYEAFVQDDDGNITESETITDKEYFDRKITNPNYGGSYMKRDKGGIVDGETTTSYYNTGADGRINAGPYLGLTLDEARDLNKSQWSDYNASIKQGERDEFMENYYSGMEETTKDYLVPAMKMASMTNPISGGIVGLMDAKQSWDEGNRGWALAGAGMEALPLLGKAKKIANLAYKPFKKPIAEALYRGFTPWSYTEASKYFNDVPMLSKISNFPNTYKYRNAMIKLGKDPDNVKALKAKAKALKSPFLYEHNLTNSISPSDYGREDAYRLYLGLDQQFGTFNKTGKHAPIYEFANLPNKANARIPNSIQKAATRVNRYNKIVGGNRLIDVDDTFRVMGRYTLKGDPNTKKLTYFDKWDLNPFKGDVDLGNSKIGKWATNKLNKFEPGKSIFGAEPMTIRGSFADIETKYRPDYYEGNILDFKKQFVDKFPNTSTTNKQIGQMYLDYKKSLRMNPTNEAYFVAKTNQMNKDLIKGGINNVYRNSRSVKDDIFNLRPSQEAFKKATGLGYDFINSGFALGGEVTGGDNTGEPITDKPPAVEGQDLDYYWPKKDFPDVIFANAKTAQDYYATKNIATRMGPKMEQSRCSGSALDACLSVNWRQGWDALTHPTHIKEVSPNTSTDAWEAQDVVRSTGMGVPGQTDNPKDWPLNTLVGYGDARGTQFITEDNPLRPRHMKSHAGWLGTGDPLMYSLGHVWRTDKSDLKEVTQITEPAENQWYFQDVLNAKVKYINDTYHLNAQPLDFSAEDYVGRLKKQGIDISDSFGDKLETFNSVILENRDKIMAETGLTPVGFNDLHKQAIALATQETRNAGALEWISDLFGSSVGMSQIQYKNMEVLDKRFPNITTVPNTNSRLKYSNDPKSPEASAIYSMLLLADNARRIKTERQRQPEAGEIIEPTRDYTAFLKKFISFADLDFLKSTYPTLGTDQNITDSEVLSYMWNNPARLRTGDAQGAKRNGDVNNKYVNNVEMFKSLIDTPDLVAVPKEVVPTEYIEPVPAVNIK